MGRKKRKNKNQDAAAGISAPDAAKAAGKRSKTEAMAGGGAAAAPAPSVPALLARPASDADTDDAYDIHHPPKVGLARWFQDTFGEEEESPWSWSPDGLEHEQTSNADGEKRKTKWFFDRDERKAGRFSGGEKKGPIADDGSQTVTKASSSFDFLRGTYRSSEGSGAITPNQDGTRTKTMSGTSATATLGGGKLTGEWGQWNETSALPRDNGNPDDKRNDKPTSGTKTDQRTRVSVIANDEDGLGLMAGTTNKQVDDRGSSKKETENAFDYGATDKGVIVKASRKQKVKTKSGWEAQYKVGGDGAFLVEVVPPAPGDASGIYRVKTTIRAGFDAHGHGARNLKPGGDAEDGAESDENKLKASIGASAGASLVYTRAMSSAEATAYLEELDGGQPGARALPFPELVMLDKVRMLAHGEGNETAAAAAVIGTPGSARALKPGDSVALTLHVGLDGELKADAEERGLGLGFELGTSQEWIRNVVVSGAPGGKVKVSIGFVKEEEYNAGASATVMYSKLAGSTTSSSSDGDAREYLLDPSEPDYDDCYSKILSVFSRDALHKLDRDEKLVAHWRRSTRTKEQNKASDASVKLLGSGIGGQDATLSSQTLVQDASGPSGEFMGGKTQNVGAGIGVDMVKRNTTNTATATVDTDGKMTAELETSKGSTDFWHTLANAPKVVGKWLGFDEHEEKDPGATEVMTGLLKKSPGERLEQLLGTTYTRLSGYHLSEHDVDVLIARAGDEHRWVSCARTASAIRPMQMLREALVSEKPDPEVQIDATQPAQVERAVKLAHARAIADFMKHAGGAGMEALTNVLRRWGEWGLRESTAAAAGSRYEWPESLAHEREKYERIVGEVVEVEATYAGLVGKPGARAAADKIHARIRNGLFAAREAILSSKDIHSERARAEMLDQIGRYETVATTAHEEVLKEIDASGGTSAGDAVASVAEPPPMGQPMAARLAPQRVRTLTRELADYPVREEALLARAEKKRKDGDQAGALNELAELRELYDFWHERSEELRGASRWAGGVAKPGPEPRVESMIALWHQISGDPTTRWPDAWRERWR